MAIRATITIFLTLLFKSVFPQSLSFALPQQLIKGATSKKPVIISEFKGYKFVSWDELADGTIHVANLERADVVNGQVVNQAIYNGQSKNAPIFIKGKNLLYLMWIDNEGIIKYTFNTSETGFKNNLPHSLQTSVQLPKVINAFALALDEKTTLLVIQSRKEEIYYSKVTFTNSNIIQCDNLTKLPFRKSGMLTGALIKENIVRLVLSGKKNS